MISSYWRTHYRYNYITFVGTTLGHVLSVTTAGQLTKLLSWEYIFYIHGGLATIWLILWGLFISDSPAENNFISIEEANYIQNNCLDKTRIQKKVI